MGACFDFRIYKTNDRKEIEAHFDREVEESLIEDGHSYSGGVGMLGKIIVWNSIAPRANKDEAEDYLSDHHEKWDNAMAVPFYISEPVKETAKAKTLKERLEKAKKAKDELVNKTRSDFYNAKSRSVTCKGCNSRLSRDHLDGCGLPNCPLPKCRSGLISDTANTRIDKAVHKIDDITKALKQATKPKATQKIGWVVGGWCSS